MLPGIVTATVTDAVSNTVSKLPCGEQGDKPPLHCHGAALKENTMAVLAVLRNDTQSADNSSHNNGTRNVTPVTAIHPETPLENSPYCQQVTILKHSQYITKIGILAHPSGRVLTGYSNPPTNIDRLQQNNDTLLDLIYQTAITNFTLGDLNQDERLIVKVNKQSQLIDHRRVDRAIENHRRGNFDYCSHSGDSRDLNAAHIETMTFEVMQEAWQQAVLRDERQKIMPYIYRRQHRFCIGSF